MALLLPQLGQGAPERTLPVSPGTPLLLLFFGTLSAFLPLKHGIESYP